MESSPLPPEPRQGTDEAPLKVARGKLPLVILASASPRRQELLRQLRLPFAVLPGTVAETQQEHLTVRELCLLNACRKARAVAKDRPDHLVLGADTLVSLDGRLFGKPSDLAEARRMLAQLQGATHQVVTGVCLLQLRRHRERLFAEVTEVTFRRLASAEIDAYLALVNPLDKAGAYAIQEQGDQIVAGISGSYSNVVGLPLERLRAELEAWAASS